MIMLRLVCSWWVIYLLWSASQTVVSTQEQSCGLLGNDDRQFYDDDREERFFLNTQNPAECNGTIDEFQYCYYKSNDEADSYGFTFAVYRETSSGTYRNVSEAFSPVRSPNASVSFLCLRFPLVSSIEVQAGDMIGACIYDPPDDPESSIRRETYVVGDQAGDLFLMRIDTNECGDFEVPKEVDVNSLSRTNSHVLHVSAIIKAFATTEPFTESSTNTMSDTMSTTRSSTNTMGETVSTTKSSMNTMGDTTSTIVPTDPSEPAPSNGGTIAAVVVILLIVVVVSAAVVIVVAVVLTHKWKKDLNSRSIDNKMYATNAMCLPQKSAADTPGEDLRPSQSQEHEYEFDTSTANNISDKRALDLECTYAEVGPQSEMTRKEAVYESPLDAPAISYSKLLEKSKEEDIYVGENPYEVPASAEDDIYVQLKSWGTRQIESEHLELVGHLGSGQFGSVEQGVWKRQGTRPVDVALKSLTKTSKEDKVKFLQEAAIMAQFKHPNVINLYGVVIREEPTKLVVEFAEKGDLREFLSTLKPDYSPSEQVPSHVPKLLLNFSQQVALGMQYLSAKGFVHRDLAARNVLVTNGNTCKVADFGMSRDLADESYYLSHGGKIPIKWTAPEAIHYKKYSTASDVWAYGCLLYEIWSLGHKPFEEISNLEVVRIIEDGKRLPPPPGCPKVIYELMILCWHPETSHRPSFRDIVLTLVGSEEVVLNIPEEDSSTNPLAGVLGAPLEAGENVYSELQRRYLKN